MLDSLEPRRIRNMRTRRGRILAEARAMIAAGGIETLTLRDLARAADVTVPTIYNLIGNKEELLVALFSDILGVLEARIGVTRSAGPLAVAEAMIHETAAIFREDESYYRAAFLAIEHLHQTRPHPPSVDRLYAWGRRLADAGVEACAEARHLNGRIARAALGSLILRVFIDNLRSWACGLASLAEFRARALADLYIILAADGIEMFRAHVFKKIAALDAAAPAPAAVQPD